MSASLGLSPVLSPSLSPIWSGMLCPPRWSCLSLFCGLVSGLVCHLGWDAVSASLGCLRSCLPACLPSGLGCSVRLPFSCLWSCLPAFVFVLSRSLSFIWDAVSAPPGLVFFLSLVLSPSLSPIWSGMLCPPPWSCLSLVSGLVSQLLSLFCLVACLSSGMLCLSPWACLFLVSGLVSQLVWDAVFAFLARLPAQLVSGLLPHPVFQLVWCVCALGLSPKLHVRFVQLFGVYGGVI